jgi:predicted nucleic acid-binding protein
VKQTVLDASTVVTLLENRPGADRVEDIVREAIDGKNELAMSVVNWGEVYYSVWRAHGRSAADKVLAEIAQLPIGVVDADRALTKLAAELKARHRLPYADCFAAALAKSRKAVLATSDEDFDVIKHQISVLKT